MFTERALYRREESEYTTKRSCANKIHVMVIDNIDSVCRVSEFHLPDFYLLMYIYTTSRIDQPFQPNSPFL